jgi:hypothetical protein
VTSLLSAYPPTISVPHAGQILGLSRNGAYAAAARGDIPVLRIGRKLVVPTHRLLELLDAPAGQASARQAPALPPASERAQRLALVLGTARRAASP